MPGSGLGIPTTTFSDGVEKMPNASDAAINFLHRILVVGGTGAGKTQQIPTLPGKKFAYLFDANALLTLRGSDIDYEEFLPEDLSVDVSSLSSSNKGKSAKVSKKQSEQYVKWEKDFETRRGDGYFDPFDWICLDSCTTFLDIIMDYVLTVNGRPGEWPNQDDYGPQMVTFVNVIRTLVGMGKSIYCTGHLLLEKDEKYGRIINMMMMTGRLRGKIPLLFSDVFAADHDVDRDGNSTYTIQTKPDAKTPNLRTSIKGLEMYENVTIDLSQPIEGQGIGGILNWERSQYEVKQPTKGGAKGKK